MTWTEKLTTEETEYIEELITNTNEIFKEEIELNDSIKKKING